MQGRWHKSYPVQYWPSLVSRENQFALITQTTEITMKMQIGMAPEQNSDDSDDDDNVNSGDDDDEDQNNVDSQDVTAWEVDSRISAEFKLDFSTNESPTPLNFLNIKST